MGITIEDPFLFSILLLHECNNVFVIREFIMNR
jgi:hypothetical protein